MVTNTVRETARSCRTSYSVRKISGVLVLRASGQVGGATAGHLRDRGWYELSLSRLSSLIPLLPSYASSLPTMLVPSKRSQSMCRYGSWQVIVLASDLTARDTAKSCTKSGLVKSSVPTTPSDDSISFSPGDLSGSPNLLGGHSKRE